METSKMYDIMGLTKQNIVFYQKFIYVDYGIFFLEDIDKLIINTDNNEKKDKNNIYKIEKNHNITKPKKKRKIHLEILRKKPFLKCKVNKDK